MKINKKKIQRFFTVGELFLSRALHSASLAKFAALILLLSSLILLDAALVTPRDKPSSSSKVRTEKAAVVPHASLSETPSQRLTKNWWDDRLLSLYGESLLDNIIDTEFADLLSKKASQRARRLNSKGNCLRAVKFDLWNVLSTLKGKKTFLDLNKVSFDPGKYHYRHNPGRSAENFRQWAQNNPISLFMELHLADVSHIPNLPLRKGFILVYAKNTHGFHRKYGHIEIVTETSPLQACSDHCRKIKRFKEPSMILAPLSNYAPLYTFEDHKNQLTPRSI